MIPSPNDAARLAAIRRNEATLWGDETEDSAWTAASKDVRFLLATVDALTATVRHTELALDGTLKTVAGWCARAAKADDRVRELEVIIEKFVVDKARLEATVADYKEANGHLAQCDAESCQAFMEALDEITQLKAQIATLEMDKVRLADESETA